MHSLSRRFVIGSSKMLSYPQCTCFHSRFQSGLATASKSTHDIQQSVVIPAKPSRIKAKKAAIILKPAALERLKALSQGPTPQLIRIGVRNKGCAGMSYHLDYVNKPERFDEVVEQEGVKVIIDSKALFSIIGSEMDWEDTRLASRFVFNSENRSALTPDDGLKVSIYRPQHQGSVWLWRELQSRLSQGPLKASSTLYHLHSGLSVACTRKPVSLFCKDHDELENMPVTLDILDIHHRVPLPAQQEQDGIAVIAESELLASPRNKATALGKRKREIESEIEQHIDILKEHDADFSTALVDNQGFPRADIDIAAIRIARARIVLLRNDLKDVMTQLSLCLQDVFFPLSPSSSSEMISASSGLPARQDALLDISDEAATVKPFAQVNGVAPGSPAEEAGLTRGDRITRFGRINERNHSSLSAIPPFLAEQENRSITLIIDRAGQQMTLDLYPKKWAGRGLLGCHIVPI